MEAPRIRKFGTFLREIFGRRVHKVGLVGGFTCPNRDGSLGTGGCSFCNPASSLPAGYRGGSDFRRQLEKGCRHVSKRFGVSLFLPYFQDYTTTYGDPEELERMYESVLSCPGVVGISLCTRPDCLDDGVLDVLERLSRKTFLLVELGVQTFDERLLADMNRLHTAGDTLDALERLRDRSIFTAAHMILGYPGHTVETAVGDAAILREAGIGGVKLQNFHVVKGTAMAKRYAEGGFEALDQNAYVEMAVSFLEETDPRAVILRLNGSAPARLTVAPEWSTDSRATTAGIEAALEALDTWQGRKTGASREDVSGAPDAGFHPVLRTIAEGTPPE